MPAAGVLCVGEVLWDSLPTGLAIGGAPFNVACHLRALGVPVRMASRVGDDRLGREALAAMARYGLDTGLVEVDATLPTGLVNVTLDAAGNASYEIVSPAAWDAIAPGDELLAAAEAAQMIVFGSLAQRSATTRTTIERLLAMPGLKVFDVNLRPPYDDPAIVRRSLERSDIVKLNEEELHRLASWLGLRGDPRALVESLAAISRCRIVCVTRGGNGAALWRDGAWTEHPGFRVEVRDTVGAGDAFLAAALASLLAGADDHALLERANLVGAYVATQSGAVPPYQSDALDRIAAAASPVGG